MPAMPDLWPSDIIPVDVPVTPIEILSAQVDLFTKKAGGRVVADIVASGGGGSKWVSYVVRLGTVSKSYVHELCRVSHGEVLVFPAHVYFSAWDDDENPSDDSGVETANSEAELLEILRRVFGHPFTKAIVTSLFALSAQGDKPGVP